MAAIVREALDGHVRDRDQVVELDAEELAKLTPIVRFEARLGRGQEGASGVVDQIEA